MPWVETDLNSPWYPVDEIPNRRLAKDYPEQHALIPVSLHKRLRKAWDELRKISAEVDGARLDNNLKRNGDVSS